jgi:glycosyltransferase involved in cell wall biosynthesis
VLFLAYFYPPLGGGGVQRSAKFVKYLPASGYDPVVVTGPANQATPWTPKDPTLAAEFLTGPEVRRIATPEPRPSTRWRSRAERWLSVPKPFSRWWIQESLRLGRSAGEDVELIYASMSPFESGEVAATLSRELGRPWVADLRDPWALDEVLVYPTLIHRRREAARMRKTLASAAAIIMNTPEASTQLVRHFAELRSKPIVTIPNGYDSDDLAPSAPARTDAAFRIVHAGFSHTAPVVGRLSSWLGGTVPGFDLMTRSHVYLLAAVERVLAEHPELSDVLEIHLAGFIYCEERERLQSLSSHVHLHGYLSHRETVALLRSADLLFLPLHDLPAGRRARTVPGKTYEYVATGRPILAAVPEGDARDLLARVGTAFICDPSDTEAMSRIILQEIERRDRGNPLPDLDRRVVEQYERRALTKRLAEVFDSVVTQPVGMSAEACMHRAAGMVPEVSIGERRS